MTSDVYFDSDEFREHYLRSLDTLRKYGDIDTNVWLKTLEFASKASHENKESVSQPTKRKSNQAQVDKIVELKAKLADSTRVFNEVFETLKHTESELAGMKRRNAALENLVELFRDGHSDSESFSEACEKHDEINRLAEG